MFARNYLAVALATALGLLAAPAFAQDTCTTTNGNSAATASGSEAFACGTGSNAYADGSTAFGAEADGFGVNSTAIGFQAGAQGDNSTAIGYEAGTNGTYATALGAHATAQFDSSTAIGGTADVYNPVTGTMLPGMTRTTGASAIGATALGAGSQALMQYSTAVGTGAATTGQNALALGAWSAAGGNASVALGFGSVAAGDNTVSVGNGSTLNRRIVNLAAGSAPTDAVNLSQLTAATSGAGAAWEGMIPWIGGGAAYNPASGIFTAPTFTVAGGTYHDVGSAFGAVNIALTGFQADALLWSTNLGAYDASHGGTAQKVSNVAAGAAATDAVNVSQLDAVANSIGDAVEYDSTAHSAVTLGGALSTAPVAIHNVADGQLSANSTDAVNGSQLYATNQTVTTNTTAITGLQSDALLYNTTLGGYDASHAGTAQQIHNLAAGTAATDAVNVGQLDAVATTAGNSVQYDQPGRTSVTLGGVGAGTAVTLTNVAPGALDATSSDAVNGSQLYATNQTVTTNTTAITSLQSDALLYSTTLGGYDASHTGTAQQIHNLAAGTAATDAVNLSQLDAATAGLGNADWQHLVSWFGGGAAYNATTSVFTAPTFTVQGNEYHDVASAFGAVDGSLTNLQSEIDNITITPPGSGGTDNNAVHYDGSSGKSVTLKGSGGTTIHNVAAGTATTDAANVGQVQAVAASTLSEAESYSEQGDTTTLNSAQAYADSRSAQTLTDANAYTDWRVNRLNDQFNRRMARTGAAASALGLMAGTAAAIHQDDTLAGAVTTFQGRPAAAFGVQHHFSDRFAMTVGASFAGDGQNAAGVGFAVGLH